MNSVGIQAIGIKIPSYAIHAKEIAKLHGIPEEKVTVGLACHMIGLCLDHENIVDLAAGAAERAIKHWGGNPADIGLIAVGTESSIDESRPLSAWVADRLHLKGMIRSYEVKHACYGGTVALRQAVEWRVAKQNDDKVALVIAADICAYEPGHPAEPTQGGGAVAFIVGKNDVCSVDVRSYAYSEPVFDFWRPTGNDFPQVDGPTSLDAYNRAVENCYKALMENQKIDSLEQFKALCFHIPFPKMALKGFRHLCHILGMSEEEQHNLSKTKVLPYMTWNHEIGNAYTASLWISAAQALSDAEPGDQIACFSYGSGFGSELFSIQRGYGPNSWESDIKKDISNREIITIEEYVKWQNKKPRRRGRTLNYI